MKLEIENVSKTYRGNTAALRSFGLEARAWGAWAARSNGAGKSTLMRILATITRPSAGGCYGTGLTSSRLPDALRTVLGYLPHDFGITQFERGGVSRVSRRVKGLDSASASNGLASYWSWSILRMPHGDLWAGLPVVCASA